MPRKATSLCRLRHFALSLSTRGLPILYMSGDMVTILRGRLAQRRDVILASHFAIYFYFSYHVSFRKAATLRERRLFSLKNAPGY